MNISRIMLFLGVLASGFSSAQELITLTRQDKHNVPVQVYKPSNPCVATAIISTGAGGSENGYEYLAEFLRLQQFLVLVVGHKESGSAVLSPMILEKGLIPALSELITTPSAYQARFMDINAAKEFAHKSPFVLVFLFHNTHIGSLKSSVESWSGISKNISVIAVVDEMNPNMSELYQDGILYLFKNDYHPLLLKQIGRAHV